MTTIAPPAHPAQPEVASVPLLSPLLSPLPPLTRRGRRPAVAAVPVALPVEQVIGGVDTHAESHTAAVVDTAGRTLGHATFTTTPAGYTALLVWMATFTATGLAGGATSGVVRIGVEGSGWRARGGGLGVEGTGTYGAGLARYLRDVAGIEVVEVDRPDRKTRRFAGKSDPIDAEAAARAALSGRAAGILKLRTGPVEAIRTLRVARSSAVGARAQAQTQIKSLVTTAPRRCARS